MLSMILTGMDQSPLMMTVQLLYLKCPLSSEQLDELLNPLQSSPNYGIDFLSYCFGFCFKFFTYHLIAQIFNNYLPVLQQLH